MTRVRFLAAKAYDIYINNSRAQLSPGDAMWHTDQYIESHPEDSDEVVIEEVAKILIAND